MKRWIEAGWLAVAVTCVLAFEPVAWAEVDGWQRPGVERLLANDVNATGAHGPQVAEVPGLAGPAERIDPDPGKGYVRLPGHVIPALARATPAPPIYQFGLPPSEPADEAPMTLTLILKRDDQAGFERYMRAVYDPHSPQFHHFMKQAQLAARFGPSPASYRAVLAYLHGRGLELLQGSDNRLTLTVRGTRAAVERAFATTIADYRLGDSDFYANRTDPALPAALAAHVQAISGLASLAVPQPTRMAIFFVVCANIAQFTQYFYYDFGTGQPQYNDSRYALLKAFAACINEQSLAAGYGKQIATDPPPPAWQGADGTGQTIGLLEFDTFNMSDVADYINLVGLPADTIDNVSQVHVDGGAGATPGQAQDEVLLDIDDVLAVAPGAKLVVYDGPFTGAGSSFQAMFNAMVNDHVDIISNSWAYCEDQTAAADVQSIDSILQSAAASGISVFNGAGDTGATCLDGSANTIAVPADSPNATAVGGTSVTLGPGFIYQGETWWDGSQSTPATGQGGFGISRFFSRPSYQDGLSSSSWRSIPDVSSNADPAKGVQICAQSLGGCPTGLSYGGTSSAAPTWAAFTALLNQSQGSNLGFMNSRLYPLADTNAFHDAASMGSDFAHVGLGSPNLANLHTHLTSQTASVASASVSEARAFGQGNSAVPPAGTPLLVAADGSSQGLIVVRLADANGNIVSGKTVSLSADGGSATISPASGVSSEDNGAVVFTVTDLTAEQLSFTASDTTDGVTLSETPSITFGVPPATSASLSVFPTEVTADGASTATIAIALQDSLGRPTPGKTITISQGSGQSVISGPVPAVTDSAGQISFTATDQTEETVTYSAVDVSDGNLPIPGSGTVTFSNATASDCTGNLPVGANGYVVTPWATGFPASDLFYADVYFQGCPGATNPAFDPSGAVYVADFYDGNLYKFDSSGGSATPGNITTNPALGPSLGGLVYGKDGNVYTTLITGGYFTEGSIVQLDPASGTILRTVATGYTCPSGLAVDPLSGDLFFDDGCYGAGSDNASLWRISDPANTDASNPTAVSVYATLPYTANATIAFAPDGTMYVATGHPVPYPGGWFIAQVSGTNAAQPATVTTLSGINSDNASLAIGATNADGSAKTLVVHETPAGDTTGGALETVDISTDPPSVVTVLATGDIGIGTIGPDGCNYVGDHHVIYKLAPASGDCGLTPTNPGPALILSPATVATNPSQGAAQTFTATLKNVASPAGTPIYFVVSGANAQIKLVDADANGQAVFTYTAVNAGADKIVASATIDTSTTTSLAVPAAVAGASPGRAVAHRHSVPAALAAQAAARAGVLHGSAAAAGFKQVQLSTASAAARASGLARSAAVKPADSSTTTSTTLASNAVLLSWNSGAHTTFLTLNPSPTSGTVGQAVSVVASLSDVSASPAVALPGQTVSFTLGGASCSATTDSSGLARCTLTPGAAGSAMLAASFAGSGSLVAASASIPFSTLVVASNSGGGGSSGGSGGSSVSGSASAGGGAVGWPVSLLLGLAALARRRRLAATLSAAVLGLLCAAPASADPSGFSLDRLFGGVRLGWAQSGLGGGQLSQQLQAKGYQVQASGGGSAGLGETAYLGYTVLRNLDLMLSYTHTADATAGLSGTVSGNTDALAHDTAALLAGYGGQVYAVSAGLRGELAPRLSLNPRVGGFVEETRARVSIGASRLDETHTLGGVTLGSGLGYRIWRGLQLCGGVDYYRAAGDRGFVLYSGSIEWRFSDPEAAL